MQTKNVAFTTNAANKPAHVQRLVLQRGHCGASRDLEKADKRTCFTHSATPPVLTFCSGYSPPGYFSASLWGVTHRLQSRQPCHLWHTFAHVRTGLTLCKHHEAGGRSCGHTQLRAAQACPSI